jgi:hypothetical protein
MSFSIHVRHPGLSPPPLFLALSQLPTPTVTLWTLSSAETISSMEHQLKLPSLTDTSHHYRSCAPWQSHHLLVSPDFILLLPHPRSHKQSFCRFPGKSPRLLHLHPLHHTHMQTPATTSLFSEALPTQLSDAREDSHTTEMSSFMSVRSHHCSESWAYFSNRLTFPLSEINNLFSLSLPHLLFHLVSADDLASHLRKKEVTEINS